MKVRNRTADRIRECLVPQQYGAARVSTNRRLAALAAALAPIAAALAGCTSASLANSPVGTPPRASLTVSPSSLTFPDTPVGGRISMDVGLANTGVETLTFTSLSITGSGAADYVPPPLGQCQSLPPGITCGLPVVFAPHGPGPSTATLTIVSNAASSPQTVKLTGNGLQGVLSIRPASPTFPDTPVGGASPLQTLLLINTGTATMIIGDISFGLEAADFPMTNPNACRLVSVPPAGSCALEVGFAPQALGSRMETLTIFSDASNSPQTVTLTGNGIAPTKILTVPNTLIFPDTVVGGFSPNQLLMITNAGNTTVNINAAALAGANPGDFSFLGGASLPASCANLSPGSSCQFTVAFLPQAAGARKATFTITSDATGSPQTVTLQGHGVAPTKILAITPNPLNFPDTVAGQHVTRLISIQNVGNAPVNISATSFAEPQGGFVALPLTCNMPGTAIVPGEFCTINVTFAPSAPGPYTATLTITSDATGSPQTVTLTGNSVAPTKILTLTPNPISFPPTAIATSATAVLVVTNTGNSAVKILSLAPLSGANPGDFSVVSSANDCRIFGGTPLSPSASCTVAFTFTPLAAGPRNAIFTLISDATGSPQTVTLTGNGVSGTLTLTPNPLSFPPTGVGVHSPQETLTITNNGPASVHFSVFSVSGANASDFQIVGNTCQPPPVLAANGICSLVFTFTPTAAGARTANFVLSSDATNGPQIVTLTGSGVNGTLTLTPNPLNFPDTAVGSTSASQVITVTSTGTSPVSISSVTLAGGNPGDFTITNTTCPLPPAMLSSSCKVSVAFAPTATGARGASFTVTSDATGSPQTVTLTGNGVAPAATTPRFAYQANPDGTLSIFTVNPTAGHLQARGYVTVPLAGAANFPVLALDPQNRFVFYGVANSVLPSSSVFTLTVDSAAGALTLQPGSLTTSGSVSAVAVDPSGQFLYVAGGSSSAGHISAFSINSTPGALTQITGSPFTAGTFPRIAMDPSGKFLYSGDSFGVSAFTIDPTTGALTPVAGSPFPASGLVQPQAITVDPKGKFVYFLNGSSNSISAYAINGTSGVLTPVPGSPFAPFAPNLVTISMAIDPTSTFVYVTNFSQVTGTSSISAYKVDATTGALTPIAGSPFAAGTAEPSWVSVDPSGAFLYMPSFDTRAGGVIKAFSITPGTGVLIPQETTPARLFPHTPVQLAISSGAAQVTTTPKYVLIANAGSNDVSAYNINLGSGTLTAVSGSPFLAGTSPVSVSTDLLGRFAYVVNSGSNDISAFGISPTTGTLAPVAGSPFTTGGTGSQSVVVDLSSEFVYAANSGSQNISEFSLNPATGALSAISGSPLGESFTPTALSGNPTGQQIFAVGMGIGNFTMGNFYDVDLNGNPNATNPNGSLSLANTLNTGSALNGSSVALHPSGKFAYVTNSGSNSVTGNALSCCQALPVPGSPFPTGTSPAGVAIEPLGRFLYVANSGSNNISAYSIDPSTGTASPLAGSPFAAGTNPSAIAVDGSGKFLLVTNKADNTVSVFTIDSNTGALTPIAGSPFVTGTAPAAITVINKLQ